MEKRTLFTFADCCAIVFVAFVALFTRLWLIADPDHITFDEVHFGNFSSWYIQERFHFDIHPPLGKMLMATIAKLTQYKGDIIYSTKFGKPYDFDDIFFVSQRITPAIFSAFTSPLMFAALRSLSVSTFASTCAAIILTSDISLIVEGKFILSDGMLHGFTMLHIFALCLFLGEPTKFRLIFASVTLGLAGACKYTALGLLAVDGMFQLYWIYDQRPSLTRIIKRASWYLIPCFMAFSLAWIWHFVATPYDGYNSEYINIKHANTIIHKESKNWSYFGQRLIGSNLLPRILKWNEVMNGVNMRSDIPHPYGSTPKYWWLLLDKWVGFLSADGGREINCMGSPACYWLSSAAIVLTAIAFFFRKTDIRNALFVWGWAVSYFPFILVPRTMFLYHYLVPLMFAIMNMVTLIENVFSPHNAAMVQTLVTVLCVLCYLFFFPWAYGTRCPDCKETRLWTDRWQQGPPKEVSMYGAQLYNTTELFGTL